MSQFNIQKKNVILGYFLCVASVLLIFINLMFLNSSVILNNSLAILAIIGFSLGVLVIYKSSQERYESLKINGLLIKGKILYISEEISAYGSAQIKPPFFSGLNKFKLTKWISYKIVSEGINPITNLTKLYFSNEMFLRPILDLSQKTEIDIFIDKANPDNYWMDISKIKVVNPPATFGKKDGYYRSYDGVNYQIVEKNAKI